MGQSDHYRKVAESRTDMDKYVPAVAQEMRVQGMISFKALWEKIEPLIQLYPDFFGKVTLEKVNNCLHGTSVEARKAGDYSHNAYAIAMALGKSAEALFGPLTPKVRLNARPPTLQEFKAYKHLGDPHDERNAGPYAIIAKRDIESTLPGIIESVLSEREAECLARHFGLAGHEPEKLADIGDSWGVSKQRANQIMDEALKRLRKPDMSEALHLLLEPPRY